MKRKSLSLAVSVLLFLSTASAAVSAALHIGVKKGDWIEYQVSVTGPTSGDHMVKWARMEVANAVGNIIDLNVTTQFSNGTYLYENITLNLDLGQLGDDFLIPANLNVGEVFFDAREGNMTISGVEQKSYAGTERTVISGNTAQTVFKWDKQTGILVEAYSSYPDLNFTMSTLADKTNIWHQSQVLGLVPTIFYALIITIVVIVALSAVLIWQRKSKS